MTTLARSIVACLLATSAVAALAQQYNPVPSGDGQYRQCIDYANRIYTGGADPSPIRGQSKVHAWCTCLWNETPDDFRGNLVTFSESERGKRINKICEKYADWSD